MTKTKQMLFFLHVATFMEKKLEIFTMTKQLLKFLNLFFYELQPTYIDACKIFTLINHQQHATHSISPERKS